MQGERTVTKNEIYAFRCRYLKYKIKNHRTSSSEVMRLEIMRQRLILHMANPELEISTSVSSLLLRIQRVELDVTIHNKLHFMEHFCVAI